MPDPLSATIGSAVIGAGSSIFGASQQASANDRATDAQVQSNKDNIKSQEKIFADQKAALAPWQTMGLDALKRIQTGIKDGSFDLSRFGMSDLIKDPGYQFRLQEGTNALETAAAARGKFISGDQVNALQGFGQQMASQEFGAAFGRAAGERDTRFNILSDMANRGYGAATALSGVTGQFGDRLASSNANMGNALAQGAINSGNIWSGLGTNIAQTANTGIGNYLLMKQLGG